MSDFFNDTANTEAQATEAQATEAVSSEAVSSEAKAKAEPATAKHARFLSEAATKRAEKLDAQAAAARADAARYAELATTLPAANAATPKARPVFEVGAEVTFRYGRTTATSQAKTLTGVVKACKDEDGKPVAYKIEAGEGFDAEVYTVQPGAILTAGESAAENEAAENEGGVAAGL